MISGFGSYLLVKENTNQFTVDWYEDIVIAIYDPTVYVMPKYEYIGKYTTGLSDVVCWIIGATFLKTLKEIINETLTGRDSCFVAICI